MSYSLCFIASWGSKSSMWSKSSASTRSTRRRPVNSISESIERDVAKKRSKTNVNQMCPHVDAILQAEKDMSEQLSSLKFSAPVTHVYNPLNYAWKAHEWYVGNFAKVGILVLLVGMNPGPWGMAQTGVPFGEVNAVRSFLGMPDDIEIGRPEQENGTRPVQGLQCKRSEVSGQRLWSEWAAANYEDADAFFAKFFVHNYCPLMFLEASGRNRTPVQLKAQERVNIESKCDVALRSVVHALRPHIVCGVGAYAEGRCKKALAVEIQAGLRTGVVLHPSPASPAANKGWVEKAMMQLNEIIEGSTNTTVDWDSLT